MLAEDGENWILGFKIDEGVPMGILYTGGIPLFCAYVCFSN